MAELMINGFLIDGYAEHELTIFKRPKGQFNIFLSKRPRETDCMVPLLFLDRHLWVICMIRDPRDVVVSKHGRDETKYWTNLRVWKECYRNVPKLAKHPRCLMVCYEDLVNEPDDVQDRILRRMPFLTKQFSFSQFHQKARPSRKSVKALGGVRPLSSGSVGAWRRHKPRLAAQLELHGSIAQALIELGYESDDSWMGELEHIAPNNHESKKAEHLTQWKYARVKLRRYILTLRYAMHISPRVSIDQPSSH
jgi:hypothetical protein